MKIAFVSCGRFIPVGNQSKNPHRTFDNGLTDSREKERERERERERGRERMKMRMFVALDRKERDPIRF